MSDAESTTSEPIDPFAPLGSAGIPLPRTSGAVQRPRLTSTGTRRGAPVRAAAPQPEAPVVAPPTPAAAPVTVGWPRARLVATAACAVLVSAVGVTVLWGTDGQGSPDRAGLVRSAPHHPAPPITLAADSEYVDTQVLDNGDLLVTHWIRTSQPVDQLTLAVPTGYGPTQSSVEVHDLVVAADGVGVTAPAVDEVAGGWVGSLPSARQLYVRYRLDGVSQLSGSADGRALATMTSLTLGAGDRPLSRMQVFSGSEVLTLACLAPGARETPVLCGTLIGGTWTLDFASGASPATVIAQLDLGGSRGR